VHRAGNVVQFVASGCREAASPQAVAPKVHNTL
jgi:hypothetical protein